MYEIPIICIVKTALKEAKTMLRNEYFLLKMLPAIITAGTKANMYPKLYSVI